jgi:hypothetical protein
MLEGLETKHLLSPALSSGFAVKTGYIVDGCAGTWWTG